jgi:Secretion system C-terminal sorting domain
MNTSATVSILNNTINYSGASLGKGVWIEDINYKFKINPSLVKVENNVLNIKGNGVQVGATHKVEIRRNKIEIMPGLPNQQVYGVLVQGSPKVVVENHSAPAFISSSSASNLNVRGVWIENSPEAFVSCNSIDNFGQHLTFSGSCPNSEMWRNTMQFGVRGVVLTNNYVIGTQGAPGLPIDNRWPGNSFSVAEVMSENGSIQEQFFVRGSGIFFPSPNVPNGAPPISLAVTNGIPSLCASGPLQINGMQLRQRIAQNQLSFPFLEPENKKLAREYLFHALDADPSLLSNDAVLQGWYAGNSNSLLGAEESVTEYSEAGNFSMALSTNAVINATLAMESNAKEVNGIYNSWAASGAGDLSAQQVSSLEAIAVQCPSEGGYAVYQARTMLCLAGNCGDYVTDCNIPAFKMADEPEGVEPIEIAVRLFPNPANEAVTLVGEMPEGAALSMVNLMGSIVNEMPYVDGLEVNTRELPAGLYFIRISLNGRVLAVEKLMIQR